MALHPRSEWATLHPNFSPAKKGVGTVVIHHTAGPAGGDTATTLRSIEMMVTHKAPGNSEPLIAIDYSLLVDVRGEVWAGRGLQNEDAATLGFNDRSVSVCAIGNYDVAQPPLALLSGIAYAIQLAIAGGWVVRNPYIEGHSDVGTFATACPGRYLEAQLPTIRTLVGGPAIGDPAPAPTVQEDEMFRVIKGDKSPQLWFGNWVQKRKIDITGPDKGLKEAAALIAGPAEGADTVTWPQAWVDAIPVVK